MQSNLEFLTKTLKFILLEPSQCRSKLSLTVLAEIWPVPRWWLRLPSPAASRLREAPPPSGFATGKKTAEGEGGK